MKPYTIVIAEQQTLLREGIRKIIDLEPDLKVAATAENGSELREAGALLRPSAVIIDTGLQLSNGIEQVVWFKERLPDTKVILFAADMEDDELIQALAAGANGFLLKDIEWDELLGQIRSVLKGHLFLPERLAKKLSNKLFRMMAGERYGTRHVQSLLERFRLTEKEFEISLLMAKGLNNRQIAEALMYSDGTVRNYVSSVYEKIGVRDRAKAVIFLRDSGFQSQAT
ncbi:response regulator transcription factor [Paenibacillus sp.]|uniref:response regulator transcription factor n=1 Tax=Paenibacillus sp. TaxID=58172 RepID=UPI002D490A02|nr:response regulator transcription factor [Paenibacillus sp.]HZG56823.1 response regulator transcription factor [Paenibacillus sp.]